MTAGPSGSASSPSERSYTGRFAPSPTGPLHFGSLLAALASYVDARAAHGRWLVRIEDLDPPREEPGAADLIVRALERYGLEWDGPVVHQSTRDAAYAAALERLRRAGKAFPCACSRAELARGVAGVGGERVYPGSCRAGVAPGRIARAWRIRVDDVPIDFVDRVQGPQRQVLARDVGDFVVRRADALWAYQLAVVVDDADFGVTDVVRGADLLASTPRQIWLQRQLGLATPGYAHVPVAVDATGEKLSKQTRARALPESAADTVAMLRRAWRLLDQADADESFRDAREFLEWAIPRWNARRIPPLAAVPASPAAGGARAVAL